MKILSFSYCFPHQAAPTWGVFVYQRLAAMAGCAEVEVVSPVPTFPVVTRWRQGARPECEEWRGVKVHRPAFFYTPGVLKSMDARFYATGLRRWLKGFVDAWRPDLLDAHFVWPDGVGVARLAQELGLPYSITLRGKIYPCLEVPSQRRQCAAALRGAAAVISVDRRMAEVAGDLGVEKSRIHVIPNGVDLDRFRPGDKLAAREELQLPTDGRLVVSVGHLGERKGHGETIQALARLPDDVRLVLVGGDSGSHRGGRKEWEHLAGSLGAADRVIFAGKQPFERVPLYYQAADLSVLASWREGCPNVVLESLACGTPVVATDVGNVPEVIEDGSNGRVVALRDVDALTAAMRDVLDWPSAGERVRRSAAVRSWNAVAERVQSVLCGVIREHKQPYRCQPNQSKGFRLSPNGLTK